VTSKGKVLALTSTALAMYSSLDESRGGSGVAFIGVVGISSKSYFANTSSY